MISKMDETTSEVLLNTKHELPLLWSEKLRECENAADINRPVVASNWRMDHRVSKIRAQRCFKVEAYAEIASRATSGCLTESLSFNNKINASNKIDIPADTALIRVVGFPKMIDLYDEYKREDNKASILDEEIRGLLAQIKNKDLYTLFSLSPQLNNALISEICDAGMQQMFGAILLKHLGGYDNLWWAGKLSGLEKHLQNPINSQALCAALGLGHLFFSPKSTNDIWLMILKYTASNDIYEQINCYRPTVLEAGNHSYHFPSPPSHQYGLTMPLSVEYAPVDELIHDLPSFISRPNLEQEVCDISFCKLSLPNFIEEEGAKKQIKQMRKQHRKYLLNNYTIEMSDIKWIKSHGKRI